MKNKFKYSLGFSSGVISTALIYHIYIKKQKEKILYEGGVGEKKRKEKSQGGIWGSWNALFSQAVSAGIRLVWFVGNSTHLISV